MAAKQLRCIWNAVLALFYSAPVPGQIATWQLGGGGLQWAGQDTVDVMVDFADGAIQPVYVTPDINIISLLFRI